MEHGVLRSDVERSVRGNRVSVHWWWSLVLLGVFVVTLFVHQLLTRPHSAVIPPPLPVPAGEDPGQNIAPGATGVDATQ